MSDDAPAPIYVLDQPSFPFPPQLSTLALDAGPARQLASGWWHLPDAAGPAALARPARRAGHRLQHLLGYLWDDTPPPPADTLCQQDIRPGHEDVITAYSGLHLDGADHHMFTAGRLPTPRVRDQREVTVIWGVCQYSARSAHVITESGRTVPITNLRHGPLGERAMRLELDDAFTLSEEETSLRLPSAGVSLASRIPAQVDVTMCADVPATATALHLLETTQRGEASPQLLLEWCEATIAERHPRLNSLLAERWQAASVGVAGSRPVRTRFTAELDVVGAYLHHALSRGRVPHTVELVDLVASHDPLWRLLVLIAPPTTPAELAYLSYSAAQLRAALSTPEEPRLAIAVENIQEFKIQRRTQTLAKELVRTEEFHATYPNARFALVGTYPLGHFWLRDPDGVVQPNLHTHDPGRWAVDKIGRHVDLVSLAKEMYPAAARQSMAVCG
jgi:hypothetical protein